MKVIKNQLDIPRLLTAENKNWERIIYNKTGVVFLVNDTGVSLMSNCGCIPLDWNCEYYYLNGKDNTQYCEITSISEMIDYISEMDGYNKCLKNHNFGKFNKSDLFWAMYARVILPKDNQWHNDGHFYQDWKLNCIEGICKETRLDMELIDIDETYCLVMVNEETDLNSTLSMIAEQLNYITQDIGIPQYKVFEDIVFQVPNTFDDLWSMISGNCIYTSSTYQKK